MKKMFLSAAIVVVGVALAGCTSVTPHEPQVHEQIAPISGHVVLTIDSGIGPAGGSQETVVQTLACDRYGYQNSPNCQVLTTQAGSAVGVEQSVATALAAAIPQAVGIAAGSIGGSALLRPSTSSLTLNNGNQISNSASSSAAAAARSRAFGQGGQGGTGGSVAPITNTNNNANNNANTTNNNNNNCLDCP